MEILLEIDEENIDSLKEMGFDVDDELYCQVDYDIKHSDPSVGLMLESYDIYNVECNGKDVSRFFCMDQLQEQVIEYELNIKEEVKNKYSEDY